MPARSPGPAPPARQRRRALAGFGTPGALHQAFAAGAAAAARGRAAGAAAAGRARACLAFPAQPAAAVAAVRAAAASGASQQRTSRAGGLARVWQGVDVAAQSINQGHGCQMHAVEAVLLLPLPLLTAETLPALWALSTLQVARLGGGGAAPPAPAAAGLSRQGGDPVLLIAARIDVAAEPLPELADQLFVSQGEEPLSASGAQQTAAALRLWDGLADRAPDRGAAHFLQVARLERYAQLQQQVEQAQDRQGRPPPPPLQQQAGNPVPIGLREIQRRLERRRKRESPPAAPPQPQVCALVPLAPLARSLWLGGCGRRRSAARCCFLALQAAAAAPAESAAACCCMPQPGRIPLACHDSVHLAAVRRRRWPTATGLFTAARAWRASACSSPYG